MAKILIVIEEEPLFAALSACLEEEGHAVERASAAGGRQAAVRSEGFDLLVADTPMPDWCGLDLLRDLRRKSRDVKVIVLIGEAESASVGYLPAVARFGAVCIVRKPFSGKELVEAVRWALSPEADRPETSTACVSPA